MQTWEEGLAELKKCLGEDPKGFKMLACMLHCCRRTWDFYKAHDISGGIFVDTMKSLLLVQSPLYGRIDLTMELKPMDYYESALFLSNIFGRG